MVDRQRQNGIEKRIQIQQIEKGARQLQTIQIQPQTHQTSDYPSQILNNHPTTTTTTTTTTTMSTHQQQQTQIMQTCQRINQMLQIPNQEFSLQALTHIDWYLTVLEAIYPQLADSFQQIKMIEDEATAIDKLLYMLTEQQIIEEDFLQIKGTDIVDGDVESVYYVVQLLNALIDRQAEEQEEQQTQQQHTQHQHPPQALSQKHHSNSSHSNQHYSNDFEESPDSPDNSPPKTNQSPVQHLPVPTSTDAHMFKKLFNHYDSQDEPSHQEQRHSVLGIHHEFQDHDDQQDQEIPPQPTSANKNHNNATFAQHSLNYPNQIPQTNSNHANIFSNPNHQKLQPDLIATGYKMTQNQLPKKQFPSSSSQQANFYEHPTNNLHQQQNKNFHQQHNKNQYEKPNKKISKPSKPSKGSKDQTQQQDDNEYFINPTIKKYKSDPKLQKTIVSGSKKSTTKKNLTKYASPIATSKQSRKLVSHPTIKKQYQKATDGEAKRLTQEVKTQVSVIMKKKKQSPQVSSVVNAAGQEIERKAKELQVKLADWKKESKIHQKLKLKASSNQTRQKTELTKMLDWRQGQLRKEKEEFEKGMQIKLQSQKQAYIKKINSLLIKLQREKQVNQRQQYKQKLLQQNEQAARRLTAIQQWYKDRIGLLKQSNVSGRNERKLMHTGHKEILKHIEKELKRENEKQIMAISMKYRRQEAQVQNDLQQLQKQIVKVYKSH